MRPLKDTISTQETKKRLKALILRGRSFITSLPPSLGVDFISYKIPVVGSVA